MLVIDLKILLRKTGAKLMLKIKLITLHIDPELLEVLSNVHFTFPKILRNVLGCISLGVDL
jgi:hypothetical protein